ncbi:MAG: DUF1993 domain-containing protein [Thermodesulfobacteriota bacterium]
MSTFATIAQYARMLTNLDRWLDKAMAHAERRKFDPNVLAQARLAPDQYCLVQQVQSACDAAKFAAAYLSGQSPPSHPDTEKTIAELRARIQTCVTYLETFGEADFAGAAQRRVAPAWMQGKSVSSEGYLTRISAPNFYFHVTTAYAILRHNGVELGKSDFIGVQAWDEIAGW